MRPGSKLPAGAIAVLLFVSPIATIGGASASGVCDSGGWDVTPSEAYAWSYTPPQGCSCQATGVSLSECEVRCAPHEGVDCEGVRQCCRVLYHHNYCTCTCIAVGHATPSYTLPCTYSKVFILYQVLQQQCRQYMSTYSTGVQQVTDTRCVQQ